jgi:hypothetical protein
LSVSRVAGPRDDSTVTDHLPRPYADEPPAPEPPSGLGLLRARPGAIAATVLLTLFLMVAFPLLTGALVGSGGYRWQPAFWLVYPAVGALGTVVPLTVIAVLARRRVTVGRFLGLLALWVLLLSAQSLLVWTVPAFVVTGDDLLLRTVIRPASEALMLLALGSLAAALFPAVTGRTDFRVMLLASVVAAALSAVRSWASVPGPDAAPLGWAVVGAVIVVGWAIAALVTSRPAVVAHLGDPAEQARQDP